MSSSVRTRNQLGDSLKLSMETLKPFRHPFIYLSFAIMTILHISFYHLQSVSQRNNLNIIKSMDLDQLFSPQSEYTNLLSIAKIIESEVSGVIFFSLILLFFCVFLINASFDENKDWKKSLYYVATRSSLKLISVTAFLCFLILLVYSAFAAMGPTVVQMVVFFVITLLPYYLLSISLPRRKLKPAVSTRFYFNILTISLFAYLLQAPIDGFCEFLFSIDIIIGFEEVWIYGHNNIATVSSILKGILRSILLISYGLWMGNISRINYRSTALDSL